MLGFGDWFSVVPVMNFSSGRFKYELQHRKYFSVTFTDPQLDCGSVGTVGLDCVCLEKADISWVQNSPCSIIKAKVTCLSKNYKILMVIT
jgi:hypothetical protein